MTIENEFERSLNKKLIDALFWFCMYFSRLLIINHSPYLPVSSPLSFSVGEGSTNGKSDRIRTEIGYKGRGKCDDYCAFQLPKVNIIFVKN